MRTFGRFDPGGRSAPRTKAGLIAVLSDDSSEYASTLLDVSRTGMRLRGAHLPAEGEDVLLLTEDLRAWGWVVRLEGEECAVEFDTPIAAIEVKRLQLLAASIEDSAHG
jgi:hypothetical protein